MILDAYKTRLERKIALAEARHAESVKTVCLLEHDLAKAKRDEAMLAGALQQLRFELEDVNQAIGPTPSTPSVPPPAKA